MSVLYMHFTFFRPSSIADLILDSINVLSDIYMHLKVEKRVIHFMAVAWNLTCSISGALLYRGSSCSNGIKMM